jgi:DNA modification methylase
MTATVLHGDCRVLMAAMVEASIDSIATDPPYELGFMGRSWDKSGIANDMAMWREALRVLKPGGMLVAFSHARTYHRMACAIEDAGFEIRDQIMWIYGSGFPKGGNRDGKGTCLKPAHEPIVVARKPFAGSVAANEAIYGTGAINIDACRVGTEVRINPAASTSSMQRKSRADIGYRSDDGVGPGSPASEAHGRWPANVVHDGSEEVVACFPETKSGGAPTAGNRNGGVFGIYAARSLTNHGSAARFFYCAKASKADRDEGLGHLAPQAFVQFQTGNGESGAASSLSEGRETQYRNIHPTVKPEDLMRWVVRLCTPPGGTVLDPFTGSGSTGKAAVLEGLDFIGCELTDEYVPIARARIAAAEVRAADVPAPSPQLGLFEDAA